MKYVQINAYADGWADSVVFKKHRELIANGDESWVFWARGDHVQDEHMVKVASYPEIVMDVLQTRIDGKAGFHSKGITRRLLKRLDKIDPDVVHMHVLLGYWINIELLFNWLASHRCKVVWTHHDCWCFTGHCIYFTKVKCMQWKTHCIHGGQSCPMRGDYPQTIAGDNVVSWNYDQKRRLFTMLPADRVQLITPSQWLADLVGESFLAKYPVKVAHNTINTSVFKPTPSDFRERHDLEDEFVVLGVASRWNDRKGLEDFVRLAEALDDRFAIVLIGLNDKQIKELPNRILRLPRTDTPVQLAEAYTAADVLFNPTREDNFPTVNLEAEACGTDVVTYDIGGCRETIELPGSMAVSGYQEAFEAFEGLLSKVSAFSENKRGNSLS